MEREVGDEGCIRKKEDYSTYTLRNANTAVTAEIYTVFWSVAFIAAGEVLIEAACETVVGASPAAVLGFVALCGC